jgi:acetyl-CoA synthetase
MVGTATTLQYVFDLQEDDRWWCAADPGWITGHSYIVYAPLVLGATSFIYEGAPNYENPPGKPTTLVVGWEAGSII